MNGLINKAREFATKAHGDQKYGKELPYAYHLEQVVLVARRYGLHEDVQVAAWLHDTLEDTDVTFEELMKEFGVTVFDLVNAVTNEAGANRKERHAKTYPKIRRDPSAVALKLCDRIANVSFSIERNDKIMELYVKEHDSFVAALQQPNELSSMWCELDNLIVKAKAMIGAKS